MTGTSIVGAVTEYGSRLVGPGAAGRTGRGPPAGASPEDKGERARPRGRAPVTSAGRRARCRRLAPHLDGEPDPAFRAATRARLVAMAAVRLPGARARSRLKRLPAPPAPRTPSAPRWRDAAHRGPGRRGAGRDRAASLVAVADGAGPGDVALRPQARHRADPARAGRRRPRARPCWASPAPGSTSWRRWSTQPNALPSPAGTAGRGGTVLAAGADPELVISTLETMDDQTTEGTAWLDRPGRDAAGGAPLDELPLWATDPERPGSPRWPRQLPGAAGAAVPHSLALLSDVSARADGAAGGADLRRRPGGRPRPTRSGPVPRHPASRRPPAAAPARPGPATGRQRATGTDRRPGTAAGTGAHGPAGAHERRPPPAPTHGRARSRGAGTGGSVVPPARAPSLPNPGRWSAVPTVLPVPVPAAGRRGSGSSLPSAGHLGRRGCPASSVCLPPLITIGDC